MIDEAEFTRTIMAMAEAFADLSAIYSSLARNLEILAESRATHDRNARVARELKEAGYE